MAAVFLLSGVLSPGTMTFDHFADVLQVASFLGVAALGQAAVILGGGIDLSIGGVITLSNIVAPAVMNGDPGRIVPVTLFCLLLGALVGLVNGLLVTRVHITPLIATLSMNSILFGAALVYTRGAPRGAVPPGFVAFGQTSFLGIPAVTWVWWLCVAIFALLLGRSTFGRRVYAVGANRLASWMTGVNVQQVSLATYVLSGVAGAIAGLLLTAYIGLPSLGIGAGAGPGSRPGRVGPGDGGHQPVQEAGPLPHRVCQRLLGEHVAHRNAPVPAVRGV